MFCALWIFMTAVSPTKCGSLMILCRLAPWASSGNMLSRLIWWCTLIARITCATFVVMQLLTRTSWPRTSAFTLAWPWSVHMKDALSRWGWSPSAAETLCFQKALFPFKWTCSVCAGLEDPEHEVPLTDSLSWEAAPVRVLWPSFLPEEEYETSHADAQCGGQERVSPIWAKSCDSRPRNTDCFE